MAESNLFVDWAQRFAPSLRQQVEQLEPFEVLFHTRTAGPQEGRTSDWMADLVRGEYLMFALDDPATQETWTFLVGKDRVLCVMDEAPGEWHEMPFAKLLTYLLQLPRPPHAFATPIDDSAVC